MRMAMGGDDPGQIRAGRGDPSASPSFGRSVGLASAVSMRMVLFSSLDSHESFMRPYCAGGLYSIGVVRARLMAVKWTNCGLFQVRPCAWASHGPADVT